LQVGPNCTLDKIPRKKIYHSDDYNANMENHTAAVTAQGADEVATRVWWDRP